METSEYFIKQIEQMHQKVLMIKTSEVPEAVTQLAQPIDIRKIKDAKALEN